MKSDPPGVDHSLGAERYSALKTALLDRQNDPLKKWLQTGGNVEWTGPNNRTLLHMASMLGNAELVKELIDRRANIEARTKEQETPLIVACKFTWMPHKFSSDVVDLLISANADPEAKDDMGNSAHSYLTHFCALTSPSAQREMHEAARCLKLVQAALWTRKPSHPPSPAPIASLPTSSASHGWYLLAREGVEVGPYTVAQLRERYLACTTKSQSRIRKGTTGRIEPTPTLAAFESALYKEESTSGKQNQGSASR